MHIRERACDEKEGDRNAKDEDNDLLIFVAFRIAVAAVPSLVHFVQEGNHEAKNGDGHDQLDDATDLGLG